MTVIILNNFKQIDDTSDLANIDTRERERERTEIKYLSLCSCSHTETHMFNQILALRKINQINFINNFFSDENVSHFLS